MGHYGVPKSLAKKNCKSCGSPSGRQHYCATCRPLFAGKGEGDRFSGGQRRYGKAFSVPRKKGRR